MAENKNNEVWVKAEEEKEVMVIGIFRRLHPLRILNNIKAFLFGGRGYGRVVIIDGNYQGHEKIIKLENEIKTGGKVHVLDPKSSITIRGLTTYFIPSNADRPIDMRGGASGDATFLEYMVEKANLAGQAAGAKDLKKMELMIMLTLGICGVMLYLVYTLVEVGV